MIRRTLPSVKQDKFRHNDTGFVLVLVRGVMTSSELAQGEGYSEFDWIALNYKRNSCLLHLVPHIVAYTLSAAVNLI